ncbi:MAG: antitoxin MazE family protein [Bifidobacteriaceae bacterium]|jgi:hypothetical protein|nr:antitoxin MazE family protein [Bifidobacteriaceae bacterium]
MVSTTARVAKHRAKLRADGFRPIQLWLPETRSAEYAAEARRQAVIANKADERDDVMDWLEESNAWPEDE